ncbi:MAG: MgtC/SapB family protein [Gemmatimonadetes bacterium]|nr:MgtC/SapB family protein [Gemmatimonadota bacterium]
MFDSIVSTNEALIRLLVAGLLGGLIGLERERSAAEGPPPFAGVRTFPLFALLGAGLTLASGGAGVLAAVGLLAVAGLVVASYLRSSHAGDIGTTTEMAALATYAVGVMAGAGALLAAGATGIAMAILLVAKERLEAFPRALSREELSAALTLAAIAAVIWPALPDVQVGPWGVWNPRGLWAMVVLVCGLSFVAFVAMRFLGHRRGLYVSGMLGGLVSSTAATVSFATRSVEAAAHSTALAIAAGLACLVMLVRVSILVAVANPALLWPLAPFLGASLIAGGAAIIALAGPAPGGEGAEGPRVTNPFRLMQAIKFALIYAAVLLVVGAAWRLLGTWGVMAAAVVAGFTDVDAITLSLARDGGTGLASHRAAAMIAVAALSNTAAKAAYAAWLGSADFRRAMLIVLGSAFGGGVLALLFAI